MEKRNFKQIDLLRKRRQNYNLASPYFVETKKYIKKGIFSGFSDITKPNFDAANKEYTSFFRYLD